MARAHTVGAEAGIAIGDIDGDGKCSRWLRSPAREYIEGRIDYFSP
jgi:hypothetical protein